MRPPFALPLLLVGLAACGDDPGFPWSDELSTAATTGASSWAVYDVVRIETAVAETDPLASLPEGCGALTGSLTAGGAPKDTDADGIPDNLTVTINATNCDTVAFIYRGTIHLSDPGTTPGYNYSADLRDTVSAHIFLRHTDVRQVRYNGATTTGSINYREWYTQFDMPGTGTEESGYSATFTLTPSGGPTLAAGAWGPSTLTFSGWIDYKDDVIPVAGPWRFSVQTVTPIVLDPSCSGYGSFAGGAFEGSLNGSGPAKFTQTWGGCDDSVISTEGTTD